MILIISRVLLQSLFRSIRVAVFGAPTTGVDRTVRELQWRGGQPVPDPMCHLSGWFPVHMAIGTAHSPSAYRATGARPRWRRWRRKTVSVWPVRSKLPLPFGLSQAPRTKSPSSFAGRQAVHVRYMWHAIQVSTPLLYTKLYNTLLAKIQCLFLGKQRLYIRGKTP